MGRELEPSTEEILASIKQILALENENTPSTQSAEKELTKTHKTQVGPTLLAEYLAEVNKRIAQSGDKIERFGSLQDANQDFRELSQAFYAIAIATRTLKISHPERFKKIYESLIEITRVSGNLGYVLNADEAVSRQRRIASENANNSWSEITRQKRFTLARVATSVCEVRKRKLSASQECANDIFQDIATYYRSENLEPPTQTAIKNALSLAVSWKKSVRIRRN